MNIGELAALGTALCWSFGSIFFTIASRRIGPALVNRLRLLLALVFLLGLQLILRTKIMPWQASASDLTWFGVSGIIGFAVGDNFLFRAFVILGPRKTMLIMSLVPVFGALLARLFMQEIIGPLKIIAIVITLLGVAWVILAQKNGAIAKGSFVEGLGMALGGALCQALGLLLSKKGLATGLDVVSGNAIRIFAAVVTVWLFSAIRGNAAQSFLRLADRKAALGVIGGAVFGPFLGVTLSLIAIQHTYIGIASTIMALPPIFLIPLSGLVFKEKITLSAVTGTIIAIFGVALIFLLPV
jgi:drug/metabolite transporter (DMT)-like permease